MVKEEILHAPSWEEIQVAIKTNGPIKASGDEVPLKPPEQMSWNWHFNVSSLGDLRLIPGASETYHNLEDKTVSSRASQKALM